MQVSLGYAKPKSIVLTPTRKKFGKLVARGSKVAIAEECLNHKDVKAAVIAKVGKLVREEVRVMCSNRHDSILKNTNPQTLRNFKCEMIINEMEECAPTLLSILRECTRPMKARKQLGSNKKRRRVATPSDRNAVIAMCTAIMCKNRRPSMCLLQKLIALILQGGRSSKQVKIIQSYCM